MLQLLNRTVDHHVFLGDSLERIEADIVDDAPLDEERRAALWLYAWLRTEGAPPAPARAHVLDFAA